MCNGSDPTKEFSKAASNCLTSGGDASLVKPEWLATVKQRTEDVKAGKLMTRQI